jgi:pyruvate dehydrogenase E2 component (dihydrolipoamide acetyltransferase)
MMSEPKLSEIVVPQVGEAVDEVILTRWLKQEGDRVRKGEALFEVDTDKVTVEVEAFEDGVLQRILSPDNSSVLPQQVVGLLAATDDGDRPSLSTPQGALHAEDAPSSNGKVSPLALRVAADLGVNVSFVSGSGLSGRVMAGDIRHAAIHKPQSQRILASPRARRLSQELGVALEGLNGTGVDGLIRSRDVEKAVTQQTSPRTQADTPPLSPMRQAIAAATTASKRDVPHFYLLADVDMSQVERLRSYCRDALGWVKTPSYTSIFVRACALALAARPEVNVTFVQGGVQQRASVDIGVAVSVGGGLLTPTLVNADRLSLTGTAEQLGSLIERARRRALRPSEMAAKSLVISNLGMYAVDAFVAIIEQPASMILAVGRVTDRVVAVAGQPAVRPMCTLTLSVDHRALDGAPAALFLSHLVRTLENPFSLM